MNPSGINNPANGVFICADGDTPGRPWVVFYYVAILTVEFILLTLSAFKGWFNRRLALRKGILFVLTRDSVYYFAL